MSPLAIETFDLYLKIKAVGLTHLSNPFMHAMHGFSHSVVSAAVASSLLSIGITSLIVGITASCLIARKRRQKHIFTSTGVINPTVEQSSAADREYIYDVPLDLPEMRSQHIDIQDNVAYVKSMSQA